jgi:hypothetical protein
MPPGHTCSRNGAGGFGPDRGCRPSLALRRSDLGRVLSRLAPSAAPALGGLSRSPRPGRWAGRTAPSGAWARPPSCGCSPAWRGRPRARSRCWGRHPDKIPPSGTRLASWPRRSRSTSGCPPRITSASARGSIADLTRHRCAEDPARPGGGHAVRGPACPVGARADAGQATAVEQRAQFYIGIAILAALTVLLLITGVQVANQYHLALTTCYADNSCGTLDTLTLGNHAVGSSSS